MHVSPHTTHRESLIYLENWKKKEVQVADQVFRQDLGCTTKDQLFHSFLARGALKLAGLGESLFRTSLHKEGRILLTASAGGANFFYKNVKKKMV